MTGHGARSITGVEIGLNYNTATEKQLTAIPGIGSKSAWNLISKRARAMRKKNTLTPYESAEAWFDDSGVQWLESFARFLSPSQSE